MRSSFRDRRCGTIEYLSVERPSIGALSRQRRERTIHCYFEADLNGSATDMTVFDVHGRAGGGIDERLERLAAIGALNRHELHGARIRPRRRGLRRRVDDRLQSIDCIDRRVIERWGAWFHVRSPTVSESKSTLSRLQQSLARLHTELSTTARVDDASKRLLREVLSDIERLLREQKTVAPAPRSRLEALAVDFDAAHPALSASLREFIDLLGRAGL